MADARMIYVQASALKLHFYSVVRILPFKRMQGGRKLVQRPRIKTEHFAHLPGGKFRTVSNKVCGHAGAAPAVALIDILDHLFAVIAGRQVQINVGPLSTGL